MNNTSSTSHDQYYDYDFFCGSTTSCSSTSFLLHENKGLSRKKPKNNTTESSTNNGATDKSDNDGFFKERNEENGSY